MPDKIAVEAMDPSKQNSPVAGPVSDEDTVTLDSASKVCLWNGQEFPEGQVVVADGTEYECSFGQWVKNH